MEPYETEDEHFYGPKADESGQVVAVISHKMNMEYEQSCYCIKKGRMSEIYHTEATMPNKYKTEWINLLAWIGYQQHIPYTLQLLTAD